MATTTTRATTKARITNRAGAAQTSFHTRAVASLLKWLSAAQRVCLLPSRLVAVSGLWRNDPLVLYTSTTRRNVYCMSLGLRPLLFALARALHLRRIHAHEKRPPMFSPVDITKRGCSPEFDPMQSARVEIERTSGDEDQLSGPIGAGLIRTILLNVHCASAPVIDPRHSFPPPGHACCAFT